MWENDIVDNNDDSDIYIYSDYSTNSNANIQWKY